MRLPACPAAMVLGLLAAPGASQPDTDPAILACVPPALRDLPISRVSASQRRPVVACLLRQSARQINEQAPIPMGDDMLESAIVGDTTIYYNIRLDVTAAEFGAEQRRRLADRTHANVCAAADMRSTIGLGGAFGYNWFDREHRLLHQTRVDRCP